LVNQLPTASLAISSTHTPIFDIFPSLQVLNQREPRLLVAVAFLESVSHRRSKSHHSLFDHRQPWPPSPVSPLLPWTGPVFNP
jgi:hypothetical protein